MHMQVPPEEKEMTQRCPLCRLPLCVGGIPLGGGMGQSWLVKIGGDVP